VVPLLEEHMAVVGRARLRHAVVEVAVLPSTMHL
jgi:hypothetical protein